MEATKTMEGAGTLKAGQGATFSGTQLPLSFLKAGQSALVAKVRGRGELHRHLENLGFVEGAEVNVVSENGGNLIIEIKGSQVALDKQVATRIITC